MLVNTELPSPPEDPDCKWLGMCIDSVHLLTEQDLKMVDDLETAFLRFWRQDNLGPEPAPKDVAVGMSFNFCCGHHHMSHEIASGDIYYSTLATLCDALDLRDQRTPA